jgi:hypothetical protein
MSKGTPDDRTGRTARPSTRTRKPLPKRVYWVRRLLVLGLAALLVLGITRLLSYGGGGSEDGRATVVGSGTLPSATTSSTVPGSALPTVVTRPGKKGRLPQPTGDCDPSDVLVTPFVREAHVAQPVRMVLRVTSLQSPACTFQVSPESVILRLLAPERSEPLWTSQDCRRAIPTMTVVARQTTPGRAALMWNGRASDDDCSNLTDWVFPGTYTAQAIAVGSTRETSSEFVLGPAVRPTVTRTPTPTASPTESRSPGRGASSSRPSPSSR